MINPLPPTLPTQKLRRKPGKSSKKLPPFVPLTWELLNSGAYKDLAPSAAKALPFFLGKVKTIFNDPQRYSIEFTFSYPEGKKLGFALSTFHKVITDPKREIKGLQKWRSFHKLEL